MKTLPPKIESVEDIKQAMDFLQQTMNETKEAMKQNRESCTSYMLWLASIAETGIKTQDPEHRIKVLENIRDSCRDTAKEILNGTSL